MSQCHSNETVTIVTRTYNVTRVCILFSLNSVDTSVVNINKEILIIPLFL